MPGFYDSDSDDSTVDGRRGSVYVAGGVEGESVHVSACIVCRVFSGCSWTGCIMEAVLALAGRSSLIRVCQGINSPAKTNQANGEKARSVSVNTTPPPFLPGFLTETSRQFTVKISLQETCGWLEILIRLDFI